MGKTRLLAWKCGLGWAGEENLLARKEFLLAGEESLLAGKSFLPSGRQILLASGEPLLSRTTILLAEEKLCRLADGVRYLRRFYGVEDCFSLHDRIRFTTEYVFTETKRGPNDFD
jgi:hypothetical protein